VLKIAPIEKSTPPEAETLAARLYAMLPRIRITDLLSEVATWTLFLDRFTHLRTGETAADSRVLMAGLLALELERRERGRRPTPDADVTLDEVLVSVEFLRPRQDRGFGDGRAELLPRHQCDDRVGAFRI
jgi:hypothetical protein